MKLIVTFAVFLVSFSFNCLAQCVGSESDILDDINQTFDKLEKYKKQKPEVEKDKTEEKETVGKFSISGLSRSEPYFNPDVLADWNVGFSEGLAKITIDGKSGFIDKKGQIVIKPQYKLASCFSNGLAAVRIGKKWGFVNSKNELVIPAKFDAADNFSEGLALVKFGKFWGFIDKAGKFIIEPKFEYAESFSEGLAIIKYYDKNYVWTTHQRPDGRWVGNFIDKTGKIKFASNFDSVYLNFNGGMAVVGRNIGYNDGVISEWFFIDTEGRRLWKLESWHLTGFSNDVIVVAVSRDEKTKRDKYSFLDRNGQRVTEKEFDNLDNFSEGLSVATINGKDGFIDKTGEFVIKPDFFSAGSFSEGLAAVWVNNESGFIDKQGNWVFKLRFNSTEGFREGFAAVETGGKIGYIDRTGNYIWKPTK